MELLEKLRSKKSTAETDYLKMIQRPDDFSESECLKILTLCGKDLNQLEHDISRVQEIFELESKLPDETEIKNSIVQDKRELLATEEELGALRIRLEALTTERDRLVSAKGHKSRLLSKLGTDRQDIMKMRAELGILQ
jgi:hypothetical protein